MSSNENFAGNERTYAGIGSRALPAVSEKLHIKIAFCLALDGYRLRSGGADGADTAFEAGADLAKQYIEQILLLKVPAHTLKRIYLPWPGFNHREDSPACVALDLSAAQRLSRQHHPSWALLSQAERKLMSRNAHQVLGDDLRSPVNFVICETPDAATTAEQTSRKSGGTGQAIRIASAFNVAVFNTRKPEHRQRLERYCETTLERLERTSGGARAMLDRFVASPGWSGARLERDALAALMGGEIDVLVHGCNCFHTMGRGIARAIADQFPQALTADRATPGGLKAKLGTYSRADVTLDSGRTVTIVNAYTQFRYGTDPLHVHADFKAIREVFTAIARDFHDKRIGLPMIGAGNANGPWSTISRIIERATCAMSHRPTLFTQGAPSCERTPICCPAPSGRHDDRPEGSRELERTQQGFDF